MRVTPGNVKRNTQLNHSRFRVLILCVIDNREDLKPGIRTATFEAVKNITSILLPP